MPRIATRPRTSAVIVREATSEDVSALALLTREFSVPSVFARMPRSGGSGRRRASTHAVIDLRGGSGHDRIARALDTPGNYLLLATHSDEPAGLLWCTVGPLGRYGTDRVLHIEKFHVRRSQRRRGVGRQLLQAAAHLAEAQGADAVTTWTGPQDREANRYFARAGFAPLAVRRIASISALRRSLTKPAELTVPFPRAAEVLRRNRRKI